MENLTGQEVGNNSLEPYKLWRESCGECKKNRQINDVDYIT